MKKQMYAKQAEPALTIETSTILDTARNNLEHLGHELHQLAKSLDNGGRDLCDRDVTLLRMATSSAIKGFAAEWAEMLDDGFTANDAEEQNCNAQNAQRFTSQIELATLLINGNYR